jgi:hypothetical protein
MFRKFQGQVGKELNGLDLDLKKKEKKKIPIPELDLHSGLYGCDKVVTLSSPRFSSSPACLLLPPALSYSKEEILVKNPTC